MLAERRDFWDHIIIQNGSIFEILNVELLAPAQISKPVCIGDVSLLRPTHFSMSFLTSYQQKGQANPPLSGTLDPLSFQELLVWQSPITRLILKKWFCTDQLCDKMEVTLPLHGLVSSLIKTGNMES